MSTRQTITSLSYLQGAMSMLHIAIIRRDKEGIGYAIAYLNVVMEEYLVDEDIEMRDSYTELAEQEFADIRRRTHPRVVLMYDDDSDD